MTDKEYPDPPTPNECGGYYCSEEHGHIDCVKHDHKCSCGGMFKEHEVGEMNCLREFTVSPIELQNDWWSVEGTEISGYSLREQRLYFRHSCGCWSRARSGSSNSISA